IVSCWETISLINSSRLAFFRSIIHAAYPVPSFLNRYENSHCWYHVEWMRILMVARQLIILPHRSADHRLPTADY
ncbi:MAG: hypothetical protein M3Y58_02645, partial [Chloroflexota bacterium]|nr:hypothetical protein [Chloroflexota bacterium]